MVVLRPAMLGAGAHRDPVLPSYRGTTTGQRSSSTPGPLPHLREDIARLSQEVGAKTSELAQAEQRAQTARESEAAAPRELANSRLEREHIIQSRAQLEQTI